MGLCIDTTIYGEDPNKYAVYLADKLNNRVVILKYKVAEEILVQPAHWVQVQFFAIQQMLPV